MPTAKELMKENADLIGRYYDMSRRLDKCEKECTSLREDVRQLSEMIRNQQKEINLLRQQVNDLMGLGKKK